MDINKFICFILLTSGVLAGCSNDEATSPEGDLLTPICLSGEILTTLEKGISRSGVDFPNQGKIKVLAAKQVGSSTADWNNLYLNNKPASTTSKGSVYNFNWSPEGIGQEVPTYYWPFDPDENLVFAAFSPTNLLYTNSSKTSLKIELEDEMEDVLYTKPTAPKNKSTENPVDLGTFQHALAKVRIVVKAVNKKNEPVSTKQFKVKEIKFKTKAISASLDLTEAKLTTYTADQYKTFTLLDRETSLEDIKGVKVERNIFPGNEEITYIGLTLTDGILDYGKNGNTSDNPTFGYKLSEFKQEGSDNLAFEAGKITTLTFYVQVTDLSSGDGDISTIILKGDLKDWEYRGDFEVGIE